MKILIPLAEGFEEIEAVTVIDLLRRAGFEIVTAALKRNPVTGAHNITVFADRLLDEILDEKFNAVVLPGGMPGSTNLKNDQRIIAIIQKISKSGGLTAAICAAPIVLENAGIMKDKKYTCYPGYEKEISGHYINNETVSDGSVITGKGAGCAIGFSLKIIEYLKDAETARKINEQIFYQGY